MQRTNLCRHKQLSVLCAKSVCVDISSLTVAVLKWTVGPPNNVYFAISIWDKYCNPYNFADTNSSDLSIWQKKENEERFTRQSALESFNGVLPQKLDSTSYVVILCDNSGSLKDKWAEIRNGVVSFVQAMQSTQDKNSSTKIYVKVMAFDGRSSLLPLSGLGSEYFDVTNANLIGLLSISAPPDTGYDPSTNLNGAVISGLSLLGQSSAAQVVGKNFLVLFSDGTDQANYVSERAVTQAVQARSDVDVYGVILDGESADGQTSNNAAQMKAYCKSGLFPIRVLSELQAAFQSISSLLSSIISNLGIFLYCSPVRNGKFNVQLRVKGIDPGSTNSYEVDSRFFDTTRAPAQERKLRGSASTAKFK
jgi:hypothetical protein